MSIQVVAIQMCVIFLLISVGFFLARKGKLSDSTTGELSGIIANVCNPAMILSSAMNKTTTVSLHKLAFIAIICAAFYGFLLILGHFMGRILRAPKKDWIFYNLMTIFSNTGFIGIPLCSAVLGNDSLVYVSVFNIFFSILMYTYGISILDKHAHLTTDKPAWRSLLNIGSVSCVLTIIIFTLDFSIPTIISETITYMGNATVFLCMIIIGASMANLPLSSIFSDKRLYAYTFLRYLCIPVIAALVLKHIITDPLILGVTVLMFAVPNGNLPMMICKEKGIETDLLARAIILTTLLSLITITITASFV